MDSNDGDGAMCVSSRSQTTHAQTDCKQAARTHREHQMNYISNMVSLLHFFFSFLPAAMKDQQQHEMYTSKWIAGAFFMQCFLCIFLLLLFAPSAQVMDILQSNKQKKKQWTKVHIPCTDVCVCATNRFIFILLRGPARSSKTHSLCLPHTKHRITSAQLQTQILFTEAILLNRTM